MASSNFPCCISFRASAKSEEAAGAESGGCCAAQKAHSKAAGSASRDTKGGRFASIPDFISKIVLPARGDATITDAFDRLPDRRGALREPAQCAVAAPFL